jgi:biotin transport system permease protein
VISAYLARPTWLHRVPAAPKLATVAALSLLVLPVGDWRLLAVGLAVVVAVYGSLGREALKRITALRPLLPVLVIVGALQGFVEGWQAGAVSLLRLVLMVLVADLVTMTTTLRAMMSAIMPLLRPFGRIGLDPERLSLAVALVLRFVPVLLAAWQGREEAWRARSSRRMPLRLVAFFVAETLVIADHVAEALDARGFSARRNSANAGRKADLP